MSKTFKKTIEGHVVLTVRIPHTFEVDAHDETYEDKYGNKYVQEEYEYGPDEILNYNANEHAKELQKDMQYLKNRGWTTEEIVIEEC